MPLGSFRGLVVPQGSQACLSRFLALVQGGLEFGEAMVADWKSGLAVILASSLPEGLACHCEDA